MKVKVRFAQPTILVKQEAYEAEQAEFERLFQENKDLRVSEAHLRDNIACLEAQIEAQRQAILHRDEQILDQFEEIKAWSSKYATVCADRDNLEAAYKQVQESLTKMVCDFSETRKELENEVKRVCKEKQDLFSWLADKDEEIAELQTEYNELNEDYDELAKAKREYAEEIDRLRNENKGLRNQMPLPEFMRQFIEMTREAVKNEFPDSGNS